MMGLKKIVVYLLVPKEVSTNLVIDACLDRSSMSTVLGVAISVKARTNIIFVKTYVA